MHLKIYFTLLLLILINMCAGPAHTQTYIKGPALIEGFSEITTSAGTTTLTKDSQTNQFFNGTSAHTVVLPDATTIPLGRSFVIQNKSTGIITVNTNGGGLLTNVGSATQIRVTVIGVGSTAGVWNVSTFGGGLDTNYFKQSGNSFGEDGLLGTNDAFGLKFKTNNTVKMQIGTNGSVAIGGSTPTNYAKLDIQGTDGALLLPRLTTVEKDALTATGGMLVYDTTLSDFSYFNGVWVSPLTNPMSAGGDIIYGGPSGSPSRLPNGTSGQYLGSNGGVSAPSWKDFKPPTVQRFTSGLSTYTPSPGVKYLKVRMVGGGGGGGGSGSGATYGSNGGNSEFLTLTASGGNGGAGDGGSYLGGPGGAATVTAPAVSIFTMTGGPGSGPMTYSGNNAGGGFGGVSCFAGGGNSGTATALHSPPANSGAGGAGNANGTSVGSGGGAGGCLEAYIYNPTETTVSVGGGGIGGFAGSGGANGGSGAFGIVIIEEYYQ